VTTTAPMRSEWVCLVSLLVSCTTPSLHSDDAPSPLPPNPDVGCVGAPPELLDPRAIRQRTDRCDPPRTFECEKREPRSHEVVRVRFILANDRATVSRMTGVLGGQSAFYRSTRECRSVPLEEALVVAAMFDEETVADCRGTMEDRDREEMFSIGGVTSMALRSQAMFCREGLVLSQPCSVVAGEKPRPRVAAVCDAIFRLGEVTR
jgi:hypothetical protein